MYGFITFATRQTLAACHRSSAVALRFPMDSRRASSATSSPILFRYLKLSATVFATEKTRSGTPSTSWVVWPKSSDCFGIERYAAAESPILADGLFRRLPSRLRRGSVFQCARIADKSLPAEE